MSYSASLANTGTGTGNERPDPPHRDGNCRPECYLGILLPTTRRKMNENYTVKKVGKVDPKGSIWCPHCHLEIRKWQPGMTICPHCGGKIKVARR